MSTSPEIVGFFSITADGQYEQSISSLRYFKAPQLPIDLNRGIESLKEKCDEYYETKANLIFTFLVHHKGEFLQKSESTKTADALIPSVQYITSVPMLRMIYCSAIDPWNCFATKYKGNIYLSKYLSKEDVEDQIRYDIYNRYRQYLKMFEHHCLSEHPNKRPDTAQAWNANTQFFCVLKRDLVGRQFLITAEVDGTDSETPLDPKNLKQWKPGQMIKLRLNCELTTERRRNTFENVKMHKIWAEAHLSGVNKVHIGFRDDHGIAKNIRCFSTFELHRIRNRSWSGSTRGEEYLKKFLDQVETDFKDIDCPYTTIKYHFDSAFQTLLSTMHEGVTEFSFLPDWYLKEMK